MPWQLCQAESDTAIGGVRIQFGIMEISLRFMAYQMATENRIKQ